MTTPLPDWVGELRPGQERAVKEIVNMYKTGTKVVFLDAPTGAGKTLIGDLVRREYTRGLYVCSSKTLQDQVVEDFPYAKVLKGRGNYDVAPPNVTAAACTWEGQNTECIWCEDHELCPYIQTRGEAAHSEMAVLNTSYWLRESQGNRSLFRGWPIAVVDECDLLEDELMRQVEFVVSKSMAKAAGVWLPPANTRYLKIADWMEKSLIPGLRKAGGRLSKGDPQSIQRKKRFGEVADQAGWVAQHLRGDGWIRADGNSFEGLVMKPVVVASHAPHRLWNKADRFLCMSATVISPRQMAEDLGLEDHEWGAVYVDSSYPVTNRPVHVVPVVDMKAGNGWDDRAREMAEGIRGVLRRHESNERVLVHCVSYKLGAVLAAELEGCGRNVVTYGEGASRDNAIDDYLTVEGSVLIAPSLDRGIDLADDACRVQVIAKVPFPYLGDKQIGARLRAPGGQGWYTTQTVRTVVQMCGRGVRHEKDHATTYVLDSGFLRVLKRNRDLFPGWWLDAVDTKSVTPKQLIGALI